jgi:hypothetical protein
MFVQHARLTVVSLRQALHSAQEEVRVRVDLLRVTGCWLGAWTWSVEVVAM